MACKGFRVRGRGLGRNAHTKAREFLSVLEMDEVFLMRDARDRLRAKGHRVTSTQALSNYACQHIDGQYIEKVEIKNRVAFWKRIA